MQNVISELLKLGPLPSSDHPDIDLLGKYQELITAINQPINNEEAIALLELFGSDECFGLAWTLLHLIETAPNWPLTEYLTNLDNEWIVRLKKRASNV